jgi:anthranilate synthase component I
MKAFQLSSYPGLTPLALFASLRKAYGAPAILLESAVQDETNRISFVACAPVQQVEVSDDIGYCLRETLAKCHSFRHNPYFSGGLMGGISFESVFDFFPKYSPKHEENIPRTLLYEFGLVCVFDHVQNLITILQHPKNQCEDIEAILRAITPISPSPLNTQIPGGKDAPDPTFLESVKTARDAIYAGEVFQLVLSHVFEEDIPTGRELDLYSALKQLEPTTHLILADYGQHGIYTCASPEIIGKKVGSHLLVSPIAGTRRRKLTEAENKKTEAELLSDPKENAEHDMLVDLGRNDLGRISIPKTIQVTKHKYLQAYAHVMHLLSDIEAEIDPQYDAVDFLKSIFPAGTLSGAPKLRAINLIQSLENSSRGFYGGATGMIATNGDLQMAINIRGVHLQNGRAKIQVGAGIVKDSVPEYEWKELQNKSQSLRRVLASLPPSKQ